MVTRAKFGQGVSFSPSANYANKQCCKNNGNERAMIICKVLVCAKHCGYYMTKLPNSGYDTTGDSRGNVYVKYHDDEFYPEYIAYYENVAINNLFSKMRL